ncbi:unnamed protein product, partial [Ranitomeya imitator]
MPCSWVGRCVDEGLPHQIPVMANLYMSTYAHGMTYTAYPLVGSTAGGTLITILFNGGIIELTGRIMTSNYEDYDFNVDFIDGSIVRKDAWSISAKQEVFLHQTFPEIHSVYPDIGSVGGGTDVAIRGDFFMDPVKVSISGNICKIKSLTPQVIICTTAPPGQYENAPFPGNRGLLYEMWIGPRASDTNDLSLQHRSVVLSASSPPDVSLIPGQPFRRCGFPLQPLQNPIPLKGIDATPLAKNKPQFWTQVTMRMAPTHQEDCRFLVLHNLHDAIVLGFPWLQDVFDEPKSSSLPPHSDCDCVIDLIPG